MDVGQLILAVNRELSPYATELIANPEAQLSSPIYTSILGTIAGHPMRLDFWDPATVVGEKFVVSFFDIRTKNQLAAANSRDSFEDALAAFPWRTALAALTH